MKPRDTAASSNGDATPEELQALLRRRAPEQQAELERTWHLTGYAPHASDVVPEEVKRATEMFEVALKASTSTPRLQGRPPVRHRRSFAWPGAVVTAVVVGLVALVWFLFIPVTVQAPPETTRAIMLADGSRVVLNSGAVLAYHRGLWRSTRTVTLGGEAYFEVARETRPFVVQTFNAEVEVLGTTFTVRARPDDVASATTVLLRTGSVQFSSRNTQASPVALAPGQMSRIVGNGLPPTAPVPFNEALAFLWLDGGFAFIDGPLSALFIELERKYGIDIEISPSFAIEDTLTWIQPSLESAEEALVDICALTGCRFERKQGGFSITRMEEVPER